MYFLDNGMIKDMRLFCFVWRAKITVILNSIGLLLLVSWIVIYSCDNRCDWKILDLLALIFCGGLLWGFGGVWVSEIFSRLSLDMFIDSWPIDSVCILYLITASSRCRLRLLLILRLEHELQYPPSWNVFLKSDPMMSRNQRGLGFGLLMIYSILLLQEFKHVELQWNVTC